MYVLGFWACVSQAGEKALDLHCVEGKLLQSFGFWGLLPVLINSLAQFKMHSTVEKRERKGRDPSLNLF